MSPRPAARDWDAASYDRVSTPQLEMARPYFRYDFIESMARVRGVQVKAAYAEAYEAIRIRL